ncbi:hypothetical protein L2U69_09625 [Zavarzinia compransoris]|uniref:hypothetical protein n=1 Tax=Zavarzinia marina TaxID=2911065 RepID=UPI001F193795|nr:hypothetical protein [Zavarzinia marina]MCF4165901.1 hypothetical protein [Zavarzinia marina]
MATDPVNGPLATPRLGTATDNARQSLDPGAARLRQQGGAPNQGDPGAAPPQPHPLSGPAVRLAAELLRLDPGLILEALTGGPDEAGRPTVITNAGMFAVTDDGVALPPPGAPLSLEVIGSGELLSVMLRGAAARGLSGRFDLQFLGNAPPTGEAMADRTLYRAVQMSADGATRASLAVHVGTAGGAEGKVLPALVTARRPLPDGTVSLTLRAADGSAVTIADAPPAIATGTRLLLEVVDRRPMAAAGPAATAKSPGVPTVASAPTVVQEFVAGRDAVTTLAPLLAERDAVLPALARLVPGLAQEGGQGLSVALLGAALKFRDFRRFIGPERETRVLSRAGPAPLLRAGAALTEFAKAATAEDTPGGWRVVPLPFFDGREIVPVTLFVHRQASSDSEEAPAGGDETQRGSSKGGRSRFVVRVELSRLGPLMIDGFAQEGRIDTLLRSRTALDEGLRDELTGRYGAVLGLSGLAGTLTFQVEDNPLGNIDFGSDADARKGGGISIEA